MRAIRRSLVLALFVGALYLGWRFAADNASPVRVHWVIGQTGELALWKVLLATFFLGAACAGLAWLRLALKARLMRRRYRRMLMALESEIHQLRNLPVSSEAGPPTEPAGRRAHAGALHERGA